MKLANVIIAVLVDIFLFFASSYSILRFFLNTTSNWNHKNVDFVVYSASSLWPRYNKTSRRLHTATWVTTSSCIMNWAEAEDR